MLKISDYACDPEATSWKYSDSDIKKTISVIEACKFYFSNSELDRAFSIAIDCLNSKLI